MVPSTRGLLYSSSPVSMLHSLAQSRSTLVRCQISTIRTFARARPRPILRPNLAETQFKGNRVAVPPVMQALLSNEMLVIERQIEFFNLIAGFEQVNKYTIYNPEGGLLGYMEEVDHSFSRAILRQVYKLHRPFTVNVYDAHGQHAMTIRRPFSLINSHIFAVLPGRDYNDSSAVVGESRQEWHLWRRRYNLYLNNAAENQMDQFARVDSPFLSFEFPALDEESRLVGSVDRNWVGLGRELFTDTGVYVLRLGNRAMPEGVPLGNELSLEQRAVMLSLAVSVDFDYFSRHSNRGGGFMYYE